MAIGERLKFRQSLQRSAKAWLELYRQFLNENRPHGLGFDGRSKSEKSPVNSNSVASGQILDAGYEIVANDETGEYEIIFGFPGYVMAIDQGIKARGFTKGLKRGRGGTSRFLSSLVKWIETKSIRTELKPLSLAFAIRTNVFKYGIKGTDLFTKVNEKFFEEYGEDIADGYMVSMEDYIIDNIKRIEETFNK
jgi:hypothetical protein